MDFKDILFEKLHMYPEQSVHLGGYFDPFLNVLSQTAQTWIGEQIENNKQLLDWPAKEWLKDSALPGILLKVSKRVLIADMNICKAEGRL